MSEVYRKRGRVVRRENELLLRIDEAGEATYDGSTFVVRPLVHEPAPPLDSANVDRIAGAILAHGPIVERVIVSEGESEHECDGVQWRENSLRVHVALAHGRWRALVEHEDVAEIAHALPRIAGERTFARLRLAPHVSASLLSTLVERIEIEQTEGARDGRGLPIERRRAVPPHPNVFRPSYRVRPVAMPFNLRAVPFGALTDAPRAIAIVNASHFLVIIDGGEAWLAPLRVGRVVAVGEPERWYPYGAGAFGAEMIVAID